MWGAIHSAEIGDGTQECETVAFASEMIIPSYDLKRNAPASAAPTGAGERRIVVCDPKLYLHTARGRKRREENEYK